MLTKFPSLYAKQQYVDELLFLYNDLALYGFLFEESKRLLAIEQSEAFRQRVQRWHEAAKAELVKMEQ